MSVYILTLFGCERHTEAWQKLDIAEGLMDTSPDSALLILESIHSEDLRKPSDKALYGLLLTQAMDKNWLESKNDSLISFAVDYYESCNNPLRQAMSNYYQGVVRYNNDNYPSAILSFFKAKEISESYKIDFYAGMSCRGIADIYNESFNSAEELHFAEKEYNHFKKIWMQPHLNYALLDYARALYNYGEYETSMSLTNNLQDSLRIYKDEYLRYGVLRLKALNYMARKMYEEAYPLLFEISNGEYAETNDTLRLCETMLEMENSNEALFLLERASDSNIALKKLVEYKIKRKQGNYLEALHHLEFIDSLTNHSFKKSKSQNLTSSVTEYFNIKSFEDGLKVKQSRIYRNLTVFCAIIVVILIIFLSIYIYRRQSQKITEKVLLAEQLTDSLNISQLENEHSYELFKGILSSRYVLLEELCTIAYQNSDDKNRRHKIADAVDKLIEDMSNRSEMIIQWEKEVDSLNDNLFSDFRHDLPRLKEIDYRLFLFIVIGLEMPVITFLLKENKIEAVYNRKRRLKTKIINMESNNKERYLKFFK